MAETTDPDYTIDEFATPDKKNDRDDDDQPYRGVLVETQEYLEAVIKEHNSFDVIDLTEQAKMTPTQQIAVHKSVVAHLKQIKSTIDNKLKELV